ncbi:MAG: hypothetical protein MPJ24_06405, partial [Pirellulaceae bacterium]|nr:hypothetical protein [Pirellulaceae bacterium]
MRLSSNHTKNDIPLAKQSIALFCLVALLVSGFPCQSISQALGQHRQTTLPTFDYSRPPQRVALRSAALPKPRDRRNSPPIDAPPQVTQPEKRPLRTGPALPRLDIHMPDIGNPYLDKISPIQPVTKGIQPLDLLATGGENRSPQILHLSRQKARQRIAEGIDLAT